MMRLEDVKQGLKIRGILPGGPVAIVDVKSLGTEVIEVTYKDEAGDLGHELLYRDRESALELLEPGAQWTFDADGALFRLVSEAYRIRLAHLFDPLLAVHTSVLEPLPHQITAVYREMLTRQPLRFLLADDPGSGKTIMAGLFMKELLIRGDLGRCLVCCPGGLAEQWQDELLRRFQLRFRIISNQTIEESATGNPYAENDLVISRLDHMSRNESIQEKLKHTDWDLVVIDEAHKMSAHFYGREIKETLRYKLGQLIGAPERTRHLLLLTATPHNGKEEDFQLFLRLLDRDRFEGRFREGVHKVDVSDLMRRLPKEGLFKFDGTPLFPERFSYTVKYQLSDQEKTLYERVTTYVTEEMNRADNLREVGEGRRGNRVGFALTILQRRLASSPEAIYQSLRRRHERLENRVLEEKSNKRSPSDRIEEAVPYPDLTDDYIEDFEDGTAEEVEEFEEQVVEQASAARTIAELEAEISTLKELEALAREVRRSTTDRKWEELSRLFQNTPELQDPVHGHKKLIIFTEHRDTLRYLVARIRALLGRAEAVVIIDGSTRREVRRKVQELFWQDKDTHVLVATDAAGEGINLHRAHLMINYDLPWNPNRLEQRFGRIHRIGQEDVCHMWNLVADGTREGDVYLRLLTKLEAEREALGGSVFDVLGQAFEGTELRRLLIEAVRYGNLPEVKAKLHKKVDEALDTKHLRDLIEQRALSRDMMTSEDVVKIKEDMDRAEARRLQPHFIRSLFRAAFETLGGSFREREAKRYEIRHVPAVIRSHERKLGLVTPVLRKYERICFEKAQIHHDGAPPADFVCPGHPLLDTTVDLIMERSGGLLKQGAVLVDPEDYGEEIRLLFYLEHSIQDARIDRDGRRRIVSKQMQFTEMTADGAIQPCGYAPYLDYEPVSDSDRQLLSANLDAEWLRQDLEQRVTSYAAQRIVPEHLAEVKQRKEHLVDRTLAAVKDRLETEIRYWDRRANELKAQELQGKSRSGLNSAKARQRADELEGRLKHRTEELEKERQISPLPPRLIGGVIVVPKGLLLKRHGAGRSIDPEKRTKSELLAMGKVMDVEKALKRIPKDVSRAKCGYDVESLIPTQGRHLFIEVKGCAKDGDEITVTKNEILTCLNKPEQYVLAIVRNDGEVAEDPIYVRQPFQKELDFGVTSVQYRVKDLVSRGVSPREMPIDEGMEKR